MKPVINKWEFVWKFLPSAYQFYGHELSFGLVKFTSLPDPGCRIERKHHKGLIITISTIPIQIKIRRRRIWFVEITYPIGLGLLKPKTWIRIW